MPWRRSIATLYQCSYAYVSSSLWVNRTNWVDTLGSLAVLECLHDPAEPAYPFAGGIAPPLLMWHFSDLGALEL
jgi:hypothetical protein